MMIKLAPCDLGEKEWFLLDICNKSINVAFDVDKQKQNETKLHQH